MRDDKFDICKCKFCVVWWVTSFSLACIMVTAMPSVFKSKNVFNAKILEKAEACSWVSQPLVFRLINHDGQEIMAIASDAAKTKLAHIEKGVVYNFIVPGACVKKSDPEACHFLSIGVHPTVT